MPEGLLCLGPISDTLVKASPILLTGLACILAFRMKLWNIGADGQMFLGAWAATAVAVFILPKTTDRVVMLGAMVLAGAAGRDGLWGHPRLPEGHVSTSTRSSPP